MDVYQCETCGKHVEIEKHEALFGNDEAYEFSQCQKCFDDSIRDFQVNDVVRLLDDNKNMILIVVEGSPTTRTTNVDFANLNKESYVLVYRNENREDLK